MMFKLLKHKLNNYRCNPSNVLYQINLINDNVLNPLSLNKEGIYGMEMLIQKDNQEAYIIAPSYYTNVEGLIGHLDYGMLENSLPNLFCYMIELSEPSFLPLGIDEFPLWDYLSQLSNSKVDIFSQLLLYNHDNNWQDTFIDQYVHYIIGNDYPVANKLGRNIQTKVLQGIYKIAQFDMGHKRNPHIEYKIKDHGYRFSFRLILHSKDEKYIRIIENEIQEILSNLDFFNKLKLYRDYDKDLFLEHYTKRIMNIKTNQILSETELMGLFMGESNVSVDTKVEYKPLQIKTTQSGIELLPKSESSLREIDEKVGQCIIQAIKDLKLNKKNNINIVEQTRSATLQRVTLDIPKGVKFSDIEKSYKDIKAIVGFEQFIIEPGNIGGTVTFSIPSEERDIIYLRDMMETEQFKKAKQEYTLPLVLGLDTLGEPLVIDLATLPHLLIGGTTGGGKSYLLNSLILNLLLTKKSNELDMYLIDPKKVEFPIFEGFSNTKVVTSVNDSINLFELICNEMDRRYDEFSEAKVRDIKGYNKKFPNKKLPYNVVVVDELADLMMVSDKQVEEYIVRLGQLARASGIHIILATQRPDANIVTGIIKANIASRIALSVSDYRNSQIILDQKGAEKLLGKGDGLAKIMGQKRELIRFQSPVITMDDSELEDILDGLKSGVNGTKTDNYDDNMDENEEEPIEKLKKIIAKTGITTVAELREQMGIRINIVSDLRKQLIEDGWLVEIGRNKYTIADEDELELYKSLD